jgi:hypothetical protein
LGAECPDPTNKQWTDRIAPFAMLPMATGTFAQEDTSSLRGVAAASR